MEKYILGSSVVDSDPKNHSICFFESCYSAVLYKSSILRSYWPHNTYETNLIHHQEYQGSEEGHERVMLLIEKQALVQAIIRESACALATNKGREVSFCCFC